MDNVRHDDEENLGSDYARDTHRGGFGGEYAREKPVTDITQEAPESSEDDDMKIGKASE